MEMESVHRLVLDRFHVAWFLFLRLFRVVAYIAVLFLFRAVWGSIVSQSESEVAHSCPSLCDPMDCDLPGSSLSMGFSRQEYWSGLPFPSPGDLPDPGLEPGSPALQVDALPSEPSGEPAVPMVWVSQFAHSPVDGHLGLFPGLGCYE